MSDQNIMAALQVRLGLFAVIKNVSIAYEGVPFTIDQTQTHLTDYLLPSTTDNPTIGAGQVRYTGIYQVTIDAPSSANPVTVRGLANDLVAYFPRGLTLTQGGQKVHITNTPSIGPLINDQGRMTRAVSINYQSDVFS